MFEQAAGELRAKLTGGGGAWQGNETTHQTTRQPPRWRRCGGHWPRCRWAAAGPGQATSRRVEAPISNPGPTGLEGAGGTRGHGCGARGRWRGLAAAPVGGGRARAGLEIDHSEPQARVWRSRGRAAAHRHTQRPGPKAGPDGHATPATPHTTPTRPPGYAKGAGTEVPAPCRLTQPLPRRGSGRMILSPGDGDASTGTCRPRRPLPGPLRRSGRRSRCGRGPSSAWWPGRRARRNRSSRP